MRAPDELRGLVEGYVGDLALTPELHDLSGLVADLTRKISRSTADELGNRVRLEHKRLDIAGSLPP